MKSTRTAIALLLAITAFVPTTSANAASPSAQPTKTNPCPDYLFVGARGSGEQTPHQKEGVSVDPNSLEQQRLPLKWLGETLGYTFVHLATDPASKFVLFGNPNPLKKKTIAWVSYGVIKGQTVYPAMGVPSNYGGLGAYLGEISTANGTLLDNSLNNFSNCTNSKLILAGYSQGAAIMRLAISRLNPKTNASLVSRITAVVLVADPLLSPKDPRLNMTRASDSRWVRNIDACGIARVMLPLEAACISSSQGIKFKALTKAIEGWGSLIAGCFNDNSKTCLSAEVTALKTAINPAYSTVEISKMTGIKNIISICYTGDAVCAPAGDRSTVDWAKSIININLKVIPFDIHSNYYKDVNVNAYTSKWIQSKVY